MPCWALISLPRTNIGIWSVLASSPRIKASPTAPPDVIIPSWRGDVIGMADLAEEVAFLNRIGVQVTVATRKPAAGLPEGVEAITARTLAVEGQDRLEGLSADGRLIPCDVVFILREVMAPDSLAPGLELDGRFVRVNREQETNIPGLYAAGDCTGGPFRWPRRWASQLTCIFVDNGLLRKDEGDMVEAMFTGHYDIQFIRVNAADRFRAGWRGSRIRAEAENHR